MRVLELFSGTHSVGKVCRDLGWEVVSLDLKEADINVDVLVWDYEAAYPKGHFDIIWASPPCHTFSNLRRSWIGRKLKSHGDTIITPQILHDDMMNSGVKILDQTKAIVRYFEPTFWFIENPQSGRMKEFNGGLPFYDVDYCQYGFTYQKSTRIWTNLMGFRPKVCRKNCPSYVNDGPTQGHPMTIALLQLKDRYKIPPDLVRELFTHAVDKTGTRKKQIPTHKKQKTKNPKI